MAISYSFNDKVILLELANHYGVDEMKETILKALADADCPGDAVLLLDLRQDEAVKQRSSEDLRDMSFFFGKIADRISSKLCMVTNDPLALGLMNMAKVYDQSRGLDCQTFTSMKDALKWLGSATA